MARPLRVEYPCAYYHVINRGNAGENIFIESVCDEFGCNKDQVKMRGARITRREQLQFILPETLAGYYVRVLVRF